MALSLQIKFGRAVARLRYRAGYSQERFAQIARIHRTYMGKLERGEKRVSIVTIEKLAKALKISASELIREAEK